MNQQRIYDWIKHPEKLNRESLYELRTLLAKYPYFHTARLLYLKNLYLLHDISFGEELRRSALYINDRKALFYLVEGDRYTLKALEKKLPEVSAGAQNIDRTLTLIDAFLSTLPEEQQQPVEAPSDYPLAMASDYSSYLLQMPEAEEEDEQAESKETVGMEIIDDFLEKKAPSSLPVERVTEQVTYEGEEEGELDDESYFTETLAKIYVKQHRYSKALEIIRKLNLKYPKKNAYFADQIRFLEKLIINTKSK